MGADKELASSQPEPPDPHKFAETFVDELKNASAHSDAPAEPFNKYLLYLGVVNNKPDEYQICKAVLEQLEDIKSPSSLPALTAILNIQVDGFPSPAEETLHALRDRASRLWYEIQLPNTNKADRSVIAFWGLVPGSPIRLSPRSSADVVRDLGKDAREALYRHLRDPKQSYQAWNDEVAIYECARLLREPVFAPKDEEVDQIFTEAGDYGKAVIISYLAEKLDRRAIPAFSNWIEEQKDQGKLAHIISYVARFKSVDDDVKNQLVDSLVRLGNGLLDNHQNGIQLSVTFTRLLAILNQAICEMGSTPESRKYFRRYRAFRQCITLDALTQMAGKEPRGLSAILDQLETADQAAQRAATQWALPNK